MPPGTAAVLWVSEKVEEPAELHQTTEQVTSWEHNDLSTRTLSNFQAEIEEEIAKAKNLVADVDDEEGPSFSEAALEMATKFLRVQSSWIWNACGHRMPVPTIGPGPDGSVDLYWKRPTWELLVNLPVHAQAFATYSGFDADGGKSKGRFDANGSAIDLSPWLMR